MPKITAPMIASWKPDEQVQVRDASDLLQVIERISRETPSQATVLCLQDPSIGSLFTCVVGASWSIATFAVSDDDPHESVSLGDLASTGLVGAYFMQHYSEFPANATVPPHAALNAAIEFLQTHERPTSIDWKPAWEDRM